MRTFPTKAIVAIAGALLASTAATAQGGGATSRSEQAAIDDVVCTYTGQCGADAVAEVPTIPAPRTRSFSLASSGAVTQPKARAAGNNYRSVSGGGGDVRRGQRVGRPVAIAPRRFLVPTTRVVAPGAAVSAPRADLLLPFRYNSAVLTPAAEARARTFARALQVDALKEKRFLIEGHTDVRGSRDLNMDLSRRRAQAVADFLVTQGVERTRVEVKGVGPDEPLPGRSAKAEANRRVEAVLLS